MSSKQHTTMKVTSQTVGSWFPTGFYGHHRMRNRPDFINEYRQLAKPQPPETFIHRLSQPPGGHVFSRHDNRNTFQRDVVYFGQGMGKKKLPGRSSTFTSDTTPSSNGYLESDRPLTSTYKHDFRFEEPNIQMLVKRPKTSFDSATTTMYRTIHGTDSPNSKLIDAMNNESLMITLQNRQQRAKMIEKDRQESVASCLAWYKPCLPPVACDPAFNYIHMEKMSGSEMKASKCCGTTNVPGGCESNTVVCVTGTDHPVQNVSEQC